MRPSLKLLCGLVAMLASMALTLPAVWACTEKPPPKYKAVFPFSVEYFYSAESAYQKIVVQQNKLIYTYLEGDACGQSIAQAPCWSAKDLKTKSAPLDEVEVETLQYHIVRHDFLELKPAYGGAAKGQRFYSYTIKVTIGKQKKDVTYQSFPGSKPAPHAFDAVQERLLELVKQKFQL